MNRVIATPVAATIQQTLPAAGEASEGPARIAARAERLRCLRGGRDDATPVRQRKRSGGRLPRASRSTSATHRDGPQTSEGKAADSGQERHS